MIALPDAAGRTFLRFFEEHGSLGRDEFLDHFRIPFLLTAVCADPATWERAAVYTLEKRTEGPAGEITLGRDGRNDVVVTHSTVSKAHAAFLHEGGTWFLADRGSRNGTAVDGADVPAGKRTRVGPGLSPLSFGDVRLSFMDPSLVLELFDQIRSSSARG